MGFTDQLTSILIRECAPIAGLIILLIFLTNNTVMEKQSKVGFFAVIFIEFIDVLVFELELWTSTFSEPTFLRVLLSVIGYAIRPLLIYIIILITVGKSKDHLVNVLLSIPIIINALIVSTAFFSDIAFSFSADNSFQRGPLGFSAYAFSAIYLAILVIVNVLYSKKRTKTGKAVLIVDVILLSVSILIQYVSDETSGVLRIGMVLSTLVYYIMLQNKALFSLVDDIPGAVANFKIVGGSYLLLSFNDTMCDMFGVSRAEYQIMTKKKIIPFLSGDYEKTGMKAIDRLKKHDSAEFMFMTVISSIEKWFSVSLKVTERYGNEIYVYSVMVDVTREKKIERELHVHEEELLLVMSQMGKLINLYDVSAKKLTMPETYARSHGFETNTVIIPSTDVAKNEIESGSFNVYNGFYERIINGEKSGTEVAHFMLSDGKWHWESADFVTIFDSEGKPKRAIIAVEDVTESYERLLVFKRYKSTIDRIVGEDKFYLEYDVTQRKLLAIEGDLFNVSDVFSRMSLNEMAKDIVGRYAKPEDSEFICEFMNRDRMISLFKAGTTHEQIERPMITPDGYEKWVRLTVDLSSDNDGNVISQLLWDDIDAEYRKQTELLSKANIDALTGILTRRAMMSEIEEYLSGDGKTGTHALIMLDLDNLKGVNDKLGHQYGDEVLKNFAKEIKGFFGVYDIVGRIGGDEFFAFIKDTSSEMISRKMQELITRLEVVYSVNGHQVETSASAGIAMYHGATKDPKTLDELYHEADVALYKSKLNGKRMFSFADTFDVLASEEPTFNGNEVISYNLRGLFNRMGVGISIYHGIKDKMNTAEPVFCNETFLKMTGLTNENYRAILGAKAFYGVHPDDRDNAVKSFIKGVETGISSQSMLRIRRSDSAYRWVRTTGKVYYYDDGSYDYYITYTDANEQAELQEMQEQINERFHEALRNVNTDTAIEYMIESLGTVFQAERAYIFERNDDGNSDNTYEWVADGVQSQKGLLQGIPSDEVDLWYRSLADNGIVVVRDINDLKDSNSKYYDIFRAKGINRLVSIPYFGDSDEPMGFFGLDNPPLDSLNSVSEVLQMACFSIQSALRRRDLIRKIDSGNMTNLCSLLDNLASGLLVYHGNSDDESYPVFCNNSFMKMSGVTLDEFISRYDSANRYGIHPDDYDRVDNAIGETVRLRGTVRCTYRMLMADGKYQWVSTFANVQCHDDGSHDLYVIISDAEEMILDKLNQEERYNNFVEKERLAISDRTAGVHLNLTENKCSNILEMLALKYELDGTSVDAFIASLEKSIDSAEFRSEFQSKFSVSAMKRSFADGKLLVEMDLPVNMRNGNMIWCRLYSDLTKNPVTGDVEARISMVKADREIRMQMSFERMIQTDYDMISNLDVDSGQYTVIGGRDPICNEYMKEEVLDFDKFIPIAVERLVDPEFRDECIRSLNRNRIVSELEKNEYYVCTFPALRSPFGEERIFQWRCSYVGAARKDILIVRIELIGFFESRHRVLHKALKEGNENVIEEYKKRRHYIVIADDSDVNRAILRLVFENEYDILEANDGEDAIRLVDEYSCDIALVFLDYTISKKTFIDVLTHIKIKDLSSVIPVIMVTDDSSEESQMLYYDYGITDVITKPFAADLVKKRANNIIELFAGRESIENQLEERNEELNEIQRISERNNELLINALSTVVEFRNLESGLHVERVRELTGIMLKTWVAIDPDFNYSDEDIEQMTRASALHDLGKIAIPDEILLKPGKLNGEEIEIMRKHPIFGCEILERLTHNDNRFYRYCYDICRYHHERYDGNGYPDKLIGDRIPVWAQVVSIIDVFDALVSKRVYKDAFTYEEAISMIRNGECGVFSPKLLKCFDLSKDKLIEVSVRMFEEEMAKQRGGGI